MDTHFPAQNVQEPHKGDRACRIGRNVKLLPKIRIGRNSIVGVNSVVISSIPPFSVVMGVPARAIGSINKYEERCVARWKEQIPPGVDTGVRNWWRSKGNMKKLREHLINCISTREKWEKKIKRNETLSLKTCFSYVCCF